MKIALIGYGKMGHMVEKIALDRGHRIVSIIDPQVGQQGRLEDADVAIEFTTPGTAEDNVRMCLSKGIPVVCGTTGWTGKAPFPPYGHPFPKAHASVLRARDEDDISLDIADEWREASQGRLAQDAPGFIWSSNFSIGVNILFAMNKRLAEIMGKYPQYTPSVSETHHIHKLDKPSGTAKTLAEALPEGTPIESIREGEVPGIHTITWESNVDTITLSHSAKSREGFALGAVIAAEWLPGHPGWHKMEEVLK